MNKKMIKFLVICSLALIVGFSAVSFTGCAANQATVENTMIGDQEGPTK